MADVRPIREHDSTRSPAPGEGPGGRPPSPRHERRPTTGRQPGKPHGRYDGRSANTRLPPTGDLGSMPRSRNRDTVTAAVLDPTGNGTERIFATVNRRVDVLENERSRGLISEAAYRTGRMVQGVFEHTRRIGGSNWAGASRRDPAEVRDTHAQRMIDDGRLADAYLERMRARLGMIDARLLQRIIGDGHSYADCAALIGRSGDRGQSYIAFRFRDALEDLAEAWKAMGKAAALPDDKHLAAAGGMGERQAAAIADGTTLVRYQEELLTLQAMRDRSPAEEREMGELVARIETMRKRG